MAALFETALLCSEDPFVEEEEELLYEPIDEQLEAHNDELLSSLLTNEHKAPTFDLISSKPADPYLHSARAEAVQWIKTTSSKFGFSALTIILAVNYLDRCFLCSPGLRLQQDKPWMKQLSAVACLSLAAKVEETQVPFLLDLQVSAAEEVTGFVFESKTIRRMELLVLSTLNWRMNPVTSLSFAQCILPKLKFCDNVVEILRRCEGVLLSVLSDWRWVKFSPSVWAAAAMLHSVGQHSDEMEHILDLLQVSKGSVEECHGLIVELMGTVGVNKRKTCCCELEPASPSGVIGSCFSYESSSSSSLDSWAMWPPSLVSSSPEPPPPSKRPNCSII